MRKDAKSSEGYYFEAVMMAVLLPSGSGLTRVAPINLLS